LIAPCWTLVKHDVKLKGASEPCKLVHDYQQGASGNIAGSVNKKQAGRQAGRQADTAPVWTDRQTFRQIQTALTLQAVVIGKDTRAPNEISRPAAFS